MRPDLARGKALDDVRNLLLGCVEELLEGYAGRRAHGCFATAGLLLAEDAREHGGLGKARNGVVAGLGAHGGEEYGACHGKLGMEPANDLGIGERSSKESSVKPSPGPLEGKMLYSPAKEKELLCL